MITRRTRVQLVVFVLITLVGVSSVGARYARLDPMFVDTAYTVVAHFEDSGGIFAGAEVSYRGVRVGLIEGWALAQAVHESISADRNTRKRAIVAVIDVSSQAYGRREEAFGIHEALAGAAGAYARRGGRPSGHRPHRRQGDVRRVSGPRLPGQPPVALNEPG